MNALTDRFEEPYEPIGVAAGTFLVLAALGTVVGAPWTTQASVVTAGIEVVGSVLMAVLGAALAYLSWTANQ
ncbi:hypothetical protein [Haloarcula litorea]|uniref:hypothetical protein n=1 Tax=Haloarcula litorea TaxID=3032579 RepID=UPI0023E78BFC|nr:hypothetical protein [Halomicroarcula sp. GDY20]